MSAAIFSLNVHAAWKCRHSGACCRAGWPIPVEEHARVVTGGNWLLPDANGVCPQFDAGSSLCRIHRDHGESMLPHSCHHFPRRALIDSRGTFVSLSHFCPTAAALLVDGDHLDLVRSPAAFPSSREYEGLDARGEWPPLLRPDVLMDDASYQVWERFLIATLGSWTNDAGTALLGVAAAADALRGWSVAHGDLAAWTLQTLVDRRCTATAADLDAARRRYRRFGSDEAFEIVCDTIPDGLPRPAPPLPLADDVASFESEWQRQGATACRYLGTRAFASWTAYQASGLRTQVAELFAAAAVLRVECLRQWQQRHALDRAAMIEAVRSADWLLVHLVDRSRLLSWLGEAER